MGGFSSITGEPTIMYADNASFDGTRRGGAMTTNGQLWIGSTSAPNVRLGNIVTDTTSTGIFVGGSGSITLSFTNGLDNLSIGTNFPSATGAANTALGIDCLNNVTTGFSNVGVGTSCLAANTGGAANTCVGYNCGSSLVGGLQNTAMGFNSLSSFTGNGDVAYGFESLSNDVSGGSNTGIGYQALTSVTAGENCAVGYLSMGSLVTGSQNTAVGKFTARAGSAFSGCTCIGYEALQLVTGNDNTACGFNCLSSVTSGVSNIGLGANAGADYDSSESSNIVIGHVGVLGESNVIRIGTPGSSAGEQNACFIAGISGVTVSASTAVLINSSGQLGTILSSMRYKENIEPLQNSDVLKLRPVTFNYIGKREKQVGLIAEEVEKIIPSLVTHNPKGQLESVKYHDLPTLLLFELQRAFKKIEDLENDIRNLKDRMNCNFS